MPRTKYPKRPLQEKTVIKLIHDLGTTQQRRNGYTVTYTDDDGAVHARARYCSLLRLYKMRRFITPEQEEAGSQLYSIWYYGPGSDHAPLTNRYDKIKLPQEVGFSIAERYTRCCETYTAIMRLLTPQQQSLVQDVCIFERPLSSKHKYWLCEKRGRIGKDFLRSLDIIQEYLNI